MRTLVVASQKGGVGKTTIAGHLGVMAELDSGPVALVDTDPQASLASWWNQRQAETPLFAALDIANLRNHIKKLAKAGVKLAIIDTPPAVTDTIRAVIAVADLVLIPTRPSPHDLRAVGSTIDLVEQAGKRLVFVINGAAQRAGTREIRRICAAYRGDESAREPEWEAVSRRRGSGGRKYGRAGESID